MDAQFTNALRDGDRVVGNWLSIGHPKVAEINGIVGFDFLVGTDTRYLIRGGTELKVVFGDATAGD